MTLSLDQSYRQRKTSKTETAVIQATITATPRWQSKARRQCAYSSTGK